MKKYRNLLLAMLACIALSACVALAGCTSSDDATDATEAETTEATETAEATDEAVELQVFAANSLSKAMEEAQAKYMESHENVTFADTQYKSSGELNELLEGGASADLLISASKSKMDDAEEAGYTDAETRIDLFVNDLVMVTAETNDSITEVTLDDIATGAYTIAVGDDSVPAGNYANQSLSTVGCFVDPEGATGKDSAGKADGTDAYAGTPLEGKVSLQTSVGNVCKQAEAGEVDIAFVYTSDVYRFGGVKVVGTVPADTHKNIVYPAALIADSENSEAAQEFLDWCATDADALAIWQAWGFEMA